VGATAGLAIGPVMLSLLLLGVALTAFNVGSVVYDALLVDVSTPSNRGRVSGVGVGVGYLGSFVGLGIGVLTLDVLGWSYSATFRALALGFLLFALPAFFFIDERGGIDDAAVPRLRQVAGRLIDSWRLASRYDGVVRFLVGRFLYTDAINTLIGGFLTIFVIEELGMDGPLVTGLLGLAILSAVIGALAAGRMVERLGPLRVLRSVLVLWMIALGSGVLSAVTGETGLAWAIGFLGGLALGATWTADRVVMLRISPPRHLGEFYGLYATVGRFATILGPLVWAMIVDVLGLGRVVAMAALAGFVALGWWTLRRVDDAERAWPQSDLPLLRTTPDAPQQ
jgi:UMF1 family MFS transporter